MISNLDLKLSGELPVNRFELLELISSWGRIEGFNVNELYIEKCEPKECYPLENLDVSQIIDFELLFACSHYNGDLSKWNLSNVTNLEMLFINSSFNNDSILNWDVSNVINMDGTFYNSNFNGDLSNWNLSSCKNMEDMFAYSYFNNNSISNWNVSNVESMRGMFEGNPVFNQNLNYWDMSNVLRLKKMFSESVFDGDISSWQFNKDVDCQDMFSRNYEFEEKYNSKTNIPRNSKIFLEWFENNRETMKEINTSKEKILDFFSFDNQTDLIKK